MALGKFELCVTEVVDVAEGGNAGFFADLADCCDYV